MLESTVEGHLREEAKKRKGMALKFVSPGKKPRPLQLKRKRMLERLGFPVYVVDNIEQIGGILDEIQST